MLKIVFGVHLQKILEIESFEDFGFQKTWFLIIDQNSGLQKI